MAEYAEQYQGESAGYSHGIADATSQVSARVEQVKVMDDRLGRLDLAVEKLTARLQPALRASEPHALDGNKLAQDSGESDLVAHLRHANARLSNVIESVTDLTARLDL